MKGVLILYNLVLTVLLIIFAIILTPILIHVLLKRTFQRQQVLSKYSPQQYNLPATEIIIATQNSKKIQLLHISENHKNPMILGIHGWENTVDRFFPLAAELIRNGYQLLLLNTRNHGKSDSDGYSTMIQFAEDLDCAVRYSRQMFGEQLPLILMGHSLGAATALYHAARDPEITGVISVASFDDLKQVIRDSFLAKHMPRFVLPLVLWYMERSYGDRFINLSPIYTVQKISAPVLLLHGDHDPIVSATAVRRIQASANPSKATVRIIHGADHSSLLDNALTTSHILEFLKNCTRAF